MDLGVMYQEDRMSEDIGEARRVKSGRDGPRRRERHARRRARFGRGQVTLDEQGSLTVDGAGLPMSTTVGAFGLDEELVVCLVEEDDFGL